MLELERNLSVARRWWWLLVAAAVLGGLVAFGLTKMLVQPTYRATAIIALAPGAQGPNGSFVSSLAATADAQLVPSLVTAQAAHRHVPEVNPRDLAAHTSSMSSIDNQLLFVTVEWRDRALAERLANAVATTFIQQERVRLAERYRVVHQGLAAEENHLSHLIRQSAGSGAAQTWLQSQYADTASKLYQQDADARIQAATQETGMQVAQPATAEAHVAARAPINGLLGAFLALLVAYVLALLATAPREVRTDAPFQPVLSKVGE